MCNLLIIKRYKSFLGGGEGIATKTFYGNHFIIEGHQRVIFWKIELGAHHGCTLPNINTSNWQYTLEHRKYGESVSVFNIIQCFSQCILTCIDSLVYQSHYMLYRYILLHQSCLCLLWSAPFLLAPQQFILGSQASLWSKWCLVLVDLLLYRLISCCHK